MTSFNNLSISANNEPHRNADLALSFRNELPQKLRLLSYAAQNEDFHEVGFIAHHIEKLFEQLGAHNEQAMALKLTETSSMSPFEVKELVDDFALKIMTGLNLESSLS